MKRDFPYRVTTVSKSAAFRMDGHWVWCGSCAYDEKTGLYHLFSSVWSKKFPFTPNWRTHSRVVRAVSQDLDGPYTWAEDVLLPRGGTFWDGCMAHNPTIHRHGDHWLLFYTGTRYSGEGPSESGPILKTGDPRTKEARSNQRIGLAIATSPEGPWERLDEPILQPRPDKWDSVMNANPAPVVHEDGSVLLYYKSSSAGTASLRYGVARAEHWRGPYRPLLDEHIRWAENDTPYEDASVWRENGIYHMLFKDIGDTLTGEHHGGCYAISQDGLNWKLSGKGYSRQLDWDDGSSTLQGSLERPQIFMKDGKPIRIFCATADGPGGFSYAENTWTQIIPLEPK